MLSIPYCASRWKLCAGNVKQTVVLNYYQKSKMRKVGKTPSIQKLTPMEQSWDNATDLMMNSAPNLLKFGGFGCRGNPHALSCVLDYHTDNHTGVGGAVPPGWMHVAPCVRCKSSAKLLFRAQDLLERDYRKIIYSCLDRIWHIS